MTDSLPAQTKRLVGYFSSWSIHAQNYHVADIPAGQLSHVIYDFANVTASGDCVSINAQDNRIRATKQPEEAAAPMRRSPAPEPIGSWPSSWPQATMATRPQASATASSRRSRGSSSSIRGDQPCRQHQSISKSTSALSTPF